MIKARELRIGSLVNVPTYEDKRTDTRVKGIELINDFPITYHVQTVHVMDLELEDIEPIPLTEEWLLKFGFNREDDDDDMTFQYELYIDSQLFLLSYLAENPLNRNLLSLQLFEMNTDALGVVIYHVHQLQNLVFALTGKELTITE